MVYSYKKDWWIAGLLFLVGLLMVCVGFGLPVLLFFTVGPNGPPWPVALMLGAVFLLEGCIGLMLWSLVFRSFCEITPTDLAIQFGPIGFGIPLGSIVEVLPKRGISPDWGWGLALSTDRLSVRYRKSNGRVAFPIIISPERKFEFMLQLAEAIPALQPCDDGALRLPPGEETMEK